MLISLNYVLAFNFTNYMIYLGVSPYNTLSEIIQGLLERVTQSIDFWNVHKICNFSNLIKHRPI